MIEVIGYIIVGLIVAVLVAVALAGTIVLVGLTLAPIIAVVAYLRDNWYKK